MDWDFSAHQFPYRGKDSEGFDHVTDRAAIDRADIEVLVDAFVRGSKGHGRTVVTSEEVGRVLDWANAIKCRWQALEAILAGYGQLSYTENGQIRVELAIGDQGQADPLGGRQCGERIFTISIQ